MKRMRWFLAALLLLIISSFVLAQEAEPTTDTTIEIDIEEVGESAEEIAGEAVEVTEAVAETTLSFLQDIANRLTQSPDNSVMRILFVIGGAILLLLGWRVYDEILIITGALVGAAIGVGLVGEASVVVQIAALLIGGLIGTLLAIFLYSLAVFFVGAYVGLIFTYGAMQTLGITASDLILLFGALLGGILLVALSVQFIILLSAIIGAQMIVLGLGLTAEWVLILTLVGIAIQLLVLRSLKIDLRNRPRRNYRKILFG